MAHGIGMGSLVSIGHCGQFVAKCVSHARHVFAYSSGPQFFRRCHDRRGHGLAVKATNVENLEHFSQVSHRKLGLIIVLLAVLQATNGLLRPHLPQASSPDTTNRTTAVAGGSSDETSNDNNKKKSGATTATTEKSTARKGWEIGHGGFGLAVLMLAWVNCTTGIDQYSLKFGDQGDGKASTVAFWSIVAVINVVTVICFFVFRFNK